MNTAPDRKSNIPDAPIAPTATTGNLLSNVAPPTALPSFVTAPEVTPEKTPEKENAVKNVDKIVKPPVNEKFCPAIPAEKGEPTLPLSSPLKSLQSAADASSNSSVAVDKIGDPMPGSALFSWMRGAVGSGGLLHKVAEKAKSSVDTIVTTLDPQMKDYLNGAADMSIAVATDDESVLAPIKEAFQAVFGRVNIIGMPCQSETTRLEPVTVNAACAVAKQKTASVRSDRPDFTNNTIILAVQNFVSEYLENRWYSQDLLLLTQQSLNIELHQYTQPTQVPMSVINSLKTTTPHDFPHLGMGFKDTVADYMAPLLQMKVLIILTAFIAMVFGAAVHTTITVQMTLQELQDAVTDPTTDPAHLPIIEQALNDILFSINHGIEQTFATVILPVVIEEGSTEIAEVATGNSEEVVQNVQESVQDVVRPVKKAPLVELIINVNAY